ncbi:MAG TPA: dephospho-CoA kinase [Candidatus Limnocylindria bacterium]|jgi:dephospho-CoA kinase
MRVIGLTGRIGCGKTTVAGMLHERGVATIDADEVAREVRQTDPNVRAAILARFGTDDPAALAAVAFRDPLALADLEAIVHPAVRDRVRDRLVALAAAETPVVAVEAIKLLESPLRDQCDAVWVVVCRPEDAVRRLEARGLSAAQAKDRMANQMAEEDMVQAADVVLSGSADLAETARQVESALAALREADATGG